MKRLSGQTQILPPYIYLLMHCIAIEDACEGAACTNFSQKQEFVHLYQMLKKGRRCDNTTRDMGTNYCTILMADTQERQL